ncbi:glycosyltransferase family 2 protein [Salinibacter ruber]|uniref:glycosyltransferase family 2 protein n=1 Tax=Salinibacter ruber TaxID=146919 RepID=UPI00216AADF7|nr:glycosyltransferase family 2 protein [Salinibacter ruber]MCS4188213.1 glycosyltransferase involved in cell wall biosynthesis [Salinibacter ruber]
MTNKASGEAEVDVSVVIPTYNRRSFVQEAIKSCFQGNEEIAVEVIVVDDGSTDDTRAYLESIEDSRVRPIFQEHQGAQVARNRGQQATRGATIKHLDDDDYLCPDALARQYKHLTEENLDASYGDVFVIGDRNHGGERFVREFGSAETLFGGLTSGKVNRVQWAYLFRRDVVADVEWDESLEFLQDFAFMHEVASRHVECGKVEGSPVAVHRAHEGFRVTDVRNEAAIVDRLDFKCQCVERACRALLEKATTEEQERRYRAQGALGIWHEAHKAAPFDFEVFRKWYNRIIALDPTFTPPRPQKALAWSDRWLTPKVTEMVINPLRRLRLD